MTPSNIIRLHVNLTVGPVTDLAASCRPGTGRLPAATPPPGPPTGYANVKRPDQQEH
jgi:hypothetical protein